MNLKTQRIKLNSNQVAYHDCGAGPIVLFVHGFPLSKQMWHSQLVALQDAFRVIAIDLPGFGDSECMDGDTVTMAQYADLIERFVDAIGIRAPITVCGLSMGGYVVWELLEKYPNRFEKVVLFHTRATADDETSARARQIHAQSVMQNGTEALIQGMIPKLLSVRSADDLRLDLNEMMAQAAPRGVSQALRGMSTRKNFEDSAKSMPFDTLVIAGAEDTITPPDEMRAMAKSMPQARFELIDGCAHLSPLEQADAVNRLLLEFLAGNR